MPNTSIMPQISKILNTSTEYLMGLNDDFESNRVSLETLKKLSQQNEENSQNTVVGWADNLYTIKKGDLSVQLPITQESTAIINKILAKMCDDIVLPEINDPNISINGDYNNGNQLGYVNVKTISKETHTNA